MGTDSNPSPSDEGLTDLIREDNSNIELGVADAAVSGSWQALFGPEGLIKEAWRDNPFILHTHYHSPATMFVPEHLRDQDGEDTRQLSSARKLAHARNFKEAVAELLSADPNSREREKEESFQSLSDDMAINRSKQTLQMGRQGGAAPETTQARTEPHEPYNDPSIFAALDTSERIDLSLTSPALLDSDVTHRPTLPAHPREGATVEVKTARQCESRALGLPLNQLKNYKNQMKNKLQGRRLSRMRRN